MFGALARAVTKHAWLVVAAWFAVAVGVIALAPPLSSITNSDQAAFLPSSAESARAAVVALRFHQSGSTANAATGIIVIQRADRASLTDADIATTSQLAQRLDASKPTATAQIAFVQEQMVAPDRDVAMITVQFTGAAEQIGVRRAVTDIRSATAAGLRGTDLQAGMTGQAAIVVDNRAAFASAEKIVTIATVALIVALLLLIFRAPVAALLPLLTVGLVFGLSSSLIAIAGHAFGFQIGQELPTMLTVVLFGIGTDYILFLLFRYRERLRAGDPPTDAIIGAAKLVGEAIFSAAFAVIAAFGALILATLGFFTTLGPSLAIGVAVMLAAALTLVPAVVSLLGRRVFWLSRSATRVSGRRSRFAAVGRLVARRPGTVILAGMIVLGVLATGVFTFRADYNPIDQLPSGTESAQAFADLQRGFPAGALSPTDVFLSAPAAITPAQVTAFTTRIAAARGVAGVLPPRITPDGRSVDVPIVIAASPYSENGLDLVMGPVRDAARAAAPAGTTVLVGGQTASLADVRAASDRDLRLIFPVAAVLFVLILIVMLRSVAAPLYLVAMVAGGFAATLGAVTLVFRSGFGDAGLQFALPIVLYVFVTAIGTDYNILMTARLREELRDGRTPREAAALAVERAGPSIAAAAVILAGTFAALLVSGVPLFAQIGFGVTFGIAMVAFVVSILLVPAATALGRGLGQDRSAGRDHLTVGVVPDLLQDRSAGR